MRFNRCQKFTCQLAIKDLISKPTSEYICNKIYFVYIKHGTCSIAVEQFFIAGILSQTKKKISTFRKNFRFT